MARKLFKDGCCFAFSLVANTVRSVVAIILVIITFVPFSAFMGIRYCCRRRRQPEQQTTQPSPAIRNYRAGRKKKPKLMSMEQVDEKFPIQTFKNATTELDERRDVNDDSSDDDELRQKVQHAADSHDEIYELQNVTTNQNTATTNKEDSKRSFDRGPELEAGAPPPPPAVEEESSTTTTLGHVHDDVEAFDPVDSDDTCAICIETMEDMDPVRLLTCGHIFHAECIDPWLTVRRACCPLCKADYYVPKPADEEQAEQNAAASQQADDREYPIIGTFNRLFNRHPQRDTPRRNSSTVRNSSEPESEAVTRRRRAAIYNIWGRRHTRPAPAATRRSSEGQAPAVATVVA
ncbi:hypothetical protein TRICI_005492 [Trichomonascus ciferrii]|uniref:RING-type domain-containing protein n=1 Tax=Trichomonascus ciferrii TaxID=44093 RepID=A0A642USG1_9ASCO|nr:hypothetical protein TRICI_005492 [Trichomonascus ciferrii]